MLWLVISFCASDALHAVLAELGLLERGRLLALILAHVVRQDEVLHALASRYGLGMAVVFPEGVASVMDDVAGTMSDWDD